MEAAEKAVRFQAYMAEYGIKEKLEEGLTTLIKSDPLPANPFAALAAAGAERWVSVCVRARARKDARKGEGGRTDVDVCLCVCRVWLVGWCERARRRLGCGRFARIVS